MGELAELAFMFRAASEGIGVARPYGDSHPYDFLVQHGRRLARVQVKSCFTKKRGYRRTQFQIHVVHALAKSKALYSQEDIDFIAAYIAPHQAWYVIPVEALGKSKTIYTLPGRQKYANWRTLRDLSRSLAPVEGTRKRANRRKQTKNASESWSHSEFIRLNLWLS